MSRREREAEHAEQRKLLASALRMRMLPWLRESGTAGLTLAEPPICLSRGVAVREERPPLPKASRKDPSFLGQYHWPEQGMMATHFVVLGCILEGEADCLFGENINAHTDPAEKGRHGGVQVVTLKEKTFLIVPPGVPRANGALPHWERPNDTGAYSQIFWLLILQAGVYCHLCTTRGKVHYSSPGVFIKNCDLDSLAQMLIEELRSRSQNFEDVARNLLLAMLLQLERHLNSGQFLFSQIDLTPQHPLPDNTIPLVQKACAYIHSHLHQPLSLPSISAHIRVSSAHLSRRFHAALGVSVMEYVTECRIDAAKYFLSKSDFGPLTIQQLSEMVGFSSASYFTRVFTERVKMSPTDFRQQEREADAHNGEGDSLPAASETT